MSKKYLMVLKNPPSSFMIDSFDEGKLIIDIKNLLCYQGDLALYIPFSNDSNIAYISEMSEEEIAEMEESLEAQKEKIREMRRKLVKPKFNFPTGKSS